VNASAGASPRAVTASFGIALSTSPEVEPEDLPRFADVAMYRANASGKAARDVSYPTCAPRRRGTPPPPPFTPRLRFAAIPATSPTQNAP
jgi:GGDEF domain-containing protein